MTTMVRFSSDISHILLNCRSSLDRSVRSSAIVNPFMMEDLSSYVGHIESIRFKFSTIARSTRFRVEASYEHQFFGACKETSAKLENLLDDLKFVQVVGEALYYPQPSRSADDIPRDIIEAFPAFKERIPILQAMSLLVEVLHNASSLIDDLPIRQQEIDFTNDKSNINVPGLVRLKKLVPSQKLSPVQFEIENEIVIIKSTPSDSTKEDAGNIGAAKTEILKKGQALIDILKDTNHDKSLLNSIQEIQEQIANDSNVINIGISNISIAKLCEGLGDEISGGVSAMVLSHHLTINMYIAQFPDWSRFVSNAASIDIDNDEIAIIRNALKEVKKELKSKKENVDKSVIDAFNRIDDAFDYPQGDKRRTALAAVRTMENLAIRTYNYVAETFEEYARETVKQVIKIAAKKTAVALLALALSSSAGLTPLANTIKELGWVRSAVDIIQKNLQ